MVGGGGGGGGRVPLVFFGGHVLFRVPGGERRGEFSPPSRVPGFLSFLWVILRPMCNDPVFSSSSCDDVAFSNPFRFFECNKPPTLYLPVMQPPPPPHTHTQRWMNKFSPKSAACGGDTDDFDFGDLVAMTIVDVFETDAGGLLLSYCPTFDNRAVHKTPELAQRIRKGVGQMRETMEIVAKSPVGKSVNMVRKRERESERERERERERGGSSRLSWQFGFAFIIAERTTLSIRRFPP